MLMSDIEVIILKIFGKFMLKEFSFSLSLSAITNLNRENARRWEERQSAAEEMNNINIVTHFENVCTKKLSEFKVDLI